MSKEEILSVSTEFGLPLRREGGKMRASKIEVNWEGGRTRLCIFKEGPTQAISVKADYLSKGDEGEKKVLTHLREATYTPLGYTPKVKAERFYNSETGEEVNGGTITIYYRPINFSPPPLGFRETVKLTAKDAIETIRNFDVRETLSSVKEALRKIGYPLELR